MNHGGYIPRRLRRSSHLATSGSCDAKRRIPRPLGRGSLYEIETKIGPPQSVRLSEGCAPSMGANLWGASPLWEYRLGLNVSKDNHEPKARAKPRGIVRRKPECKRCEATDRNRIVKAEGCEASWHMAAKPTGTRLAGRAGPEARPFARHKQSTGLFVSGLSLR